MIVKIIMNKEDSLLHISLEVLFFAILFSFSIYTITLEQIRLTGITSVKNKHFKSKQEESFTGEFSIQEIVDVVDNSLRFKVTDFDNKTINIKPRYNYAGGNHHISISSTSQNKWIITSRPTFWTLWDYGQGLRNVKELQSLLNS